MSEQSLAADARLAWGLVPKDCKIALTLLHANPEAWQKAREAIVAEAASSIKLLPNAPTVIDICCALELAAEHYLEDHPL